MKLLSFVRRNASPLVFALALLLCATFAHSQNVRSDGVISSRSGAPAPGAFVAVCSQPATINVTPCTPLVSLCSSLTDVICTQPNPVQADGLGNYHFYVPVASLPVTLQFYGSTVTTSSLPDQSFGSAGGITGATPSGGLGQTGSTLNLLNCPIGNTEVSTGAFTWTCGSSSGSAGGTLENCTPDQSGNSFYGITTFGTYLYASWQFVFNTTTYINCTVYVPVAQNGATIVLDIAANDAIAGHTASFQLCDQAFNTGSLNTGSLTCGATQTYTTTSTGFNRVTLTFNVNSTLSNGTLLVVKILTSPTGTPPTANLLVYPHFIL